jgi:hypothetical protein
VSQMRHDTSPSSAVVAQLKLATFGWQPKPVAFAARLVRDYPKIDFINIS